MPAARSPAQIEASRRNGARSRGPATPEGKARSRLNALRHGMRAERLGLLPGEDAEGADAFFARVRADIAPAGEVELGLAEAVAAAWWRAQRADRLEATLLTAAHVWGEHDGENSAGARLARDAGALRALAGIVRYRAQAEGEARRGLALLLRLRREGLVGGGANEPDDPSTNEPGNPLATRAANANEPTELAPNEPEDPGVATAANANEPESPAPNEPGNPRSTRVPAPNEPGRPALGPAGADREEPEPAALATTPPPNPSACRT
jgi:hypothetical protein